MSIHSPISSHSASSVPSTLDRRSFARASEPVRAVDTKGWAASTGEVILLLTMILCIVPHTLVALPIEALVLQWERLSGLQDGQGGFTGFDLMYLLGYAAMAALLLTGIRRARSEITVEPAAVAARDFLIALCPIIVLYLIDPFHSHAFAFRYTWWPFVTFGALLVVVMHLGQEQARRIRDVLAICLSVQAATAIFYYVTGINTFHNPHFGNRAQGTFDNPSVLYSLCLIGVPLCLTLARAATAQARRNALLLGATLNAVALLLTFMRAGYLGLAAALVYLAVFPVDRRSGSASPRGSGGKAIGSRKGERAIALGIATALLVGAVFIRTHGRVIGDATDRPFWGRIAIWRVATQVAVQHPWLGNGISTYAVAQRQNMTRDLSQFDPENTEPKNLYLSLFIDFGLVGCFLFGLSAWRYVAAYRAARTRFAPEDDRAATARGLNAALLALLVAGLFDTPLLQFYRLPTTLSVMVLLGCLCVWLREGGIENRVREPRRKVKFLSWQQRILQSGLKAFGGITLGLFTCIGIVAVADQHNKRVHSQVVALCQPERPCPSGGISLEEIAPALRDATRAAEAASTEAIAAAGPAATISDSDEERIALKAAHNLRMRDMGAEDGSMVSRYREIELAAEMARTMPGDLILDMYLNTVDYGFGQHGVTAAALHFFGKAPAGLSLAESALLASLAANPPAFASSLDAASLRERRQEVLDRLDQCFPGHDSAADLHASALAPLDFAPLSQLEMPSARQPGESARRNEQPIALK